MSDNETLTIFEDKVYRPSEKLPEDWLSKFAQGEQAALGLTDEEAEGKIVPAEDARLADLLNEDILEKFQNLNPDYQKGIKIWVSSLDQMAELLRDISENY